MAATKRESGKAFLERMLRLDPRSPEEREMERQGIVFANRRASAPVLADLRLVGFDVRSVALLRLHGDYRAAIPVLLKWLPLMTNRDVKEDIIRTLSAPWARSEVLPVFLNDFQSTEDESIRWVIGNGLRLLAKKSDFEALDRLARERRFGTGRQMIVLALGRMKDPRAVDTLMCLLDDPQVAMMAIMALGKLKAQRARAQIAGFLDNPNPDLRREAKKALAAIDRLHTKPGER